MGMEYTLLLQDDFDWEYVRTSKTEKLAEFIQSWAAFVGQEPELVATWGGHAVFDLGKKAPDIAGRPDLIRKFCDSAYWWSDNEPYRKEKL